MRTLDIKLATLLQTLASPPDCPKVGSMDFGERLTVVLKNVSLVAILAGHTVLMPGALLAGLASDKHRKVQFRVSQKGERDRALGQVQRTAREEAVFGENAHRIEDEDDDWAAALVPGVSVVATGCLGLTVEDPADEPHVVRCCGFRSRRQREICLGVVCARESWVCKSQLFANKLSPKGDRPGMGWTDAFPARPVKDDRVLACASALDPCNSGRCPLSTGGLARWPPCWLSFAAASGRQGCWSRHPVRVLGAALSSNDISSPKPSTRSSTSSSSLCPTHPSPAFTTPPSPIPAVFSVSSPFLRVIGENTSREA